MTEAAETQTADVLIVGAGPAGLVAALAATQQGFRVCIADTAPDASGKAASGRSAALLSQTIEMLKRLGIWRDCESVAAPLTSLQFIDDTKRLIRAPDTVFRSEEIGEPAFGYNIANADLVRILKARLLEANVPIHLTGTIAQADFLDGHVVVRFERGLTVNAQLAIAADGKYSPLRDVAGLRKLAWTYDQTAIATSFSHERPHHGRCIEIHRAAGPFTLVPLPGHRSSLVWVERRQEAERLAALDDDTFGREVEAVSRMALGRISAVGARAAFPLSSLAVNEYGKSRVALVGEAAHVTPPIGAQGLNLGFRDVAALISLIVEVRAAGQDIGADRVLKAYSSSRRGDVLTRTAGVDVLNRSLLSDFAPFALARSAGLMALGSMGPVRRAFMRRGISPRT